MLALTATPYMSLMIAATASIASYACFRTAVFTATGDRNQKQSAQSGSTLLKKLFSGEIVIGVCEFGLGVYLFLACVLTLNP